MGVKFGAKYLTGEKKVYIWVNEQWIWLDQKLYIMVHGEIGM